jgi:RNA polymerase sigma-B factor
LLEFTSVTTAAQPPVPAFDRRRRTADEQRLALRYRERGDLAARDALIERLMPLARQLASRYRHSGEPADDLLQVASLGLVKAIDRFDPGRGNAISTYAVPTILGELRRHFRDHTWSVRVSRELQERVLRLERVSGELASTLGRSPSVAELGDRLGLSAEEVLEAIEAAGAYRSASLEEQLGGGDGAEDVALIDVLGDDDARLELVEDAAAVDGAMHVLDERARRILHMRFMEDMTQLQIAHALGISQMHVSRLLRKALTALRERADAGIPA